MPKYATLLLRFLFICALAVITSCANVVAPSGGPKDVTPPAYVKSEPAQGASGVLARKMEIRFNEFVQLNDPFTKVVISPPVEEFPEFRTRGKYVVVTFPKALQSGMTYSIDFGDCIQDITEDNPYSNFRYVFSTGDHVDSLSLLGFVINAFSLEPEKAASVYLYRNGYDSIPYKKIPDFIARTRVDGSFEFTNLPSGNYKIFVLRDNNTNMIYDQPNEGIAFLDSLVIPQYIPLPDTIKATDSTKSDSIVMPVIKHYLLRLFEEIDTNQRLLKAQTPQLGQFQLIFKWPVRDLQYRFLKKPQSGSWVLNEFSKNRDTVSCWVTDIHLDSVFIEVSDQGIVMDTLEIGMKRMADTTKQINNRSGKGNSGKEQQFKLIVQTNAGPGRNLDLNGQLKLQFLHPVADYDLSKVILKEIIDSVGIPVKATMAFTDPGINRHLEIVYPWKAQASYAIEILPAVFRDIYGLSNDSVFVKFNTTQYEDYGVLKINLKLPDNSNCIFQLLNESNSVVLETPVSTSRLLTYEYMKAGNYKARIVYDNNGNGKWDTGCYLRNIQPEKVMNYPRTMSIKKNWDTEIDWEIK